MATDNKFYDTNAVNIHGLLISKNLPLQMFRIPRFQRDYAWKEQEIAEFWSDIYGNYIQYMDLKEEGLPHDLMKSQYMLGPMVLLRNETERLEWSVIDGQQRLATLTIMFSVIRDIAYDLDQNYEKSPLYEQIRDLTVQYYKGKDYGPKLVMNQNDDEFFKVRISKQDTPQEKILQWNNDRKDKDKKDSFTDSQKQIMKCYEYFYGELSKALLTGFVGNQDIDELEDDEIRNKIINKIKNNPDEYDLQDDFFEDWDGNKFKALEPKDEKEIQREGRYYKKWYEKHDGKTTISDYRNHRVEQKEKRLKRIVKKIITVTKLKQDRQKCIDNLDKMKDFLDSVIVDNFVVCVKVDEDSDAYQIFETLNARGKTLSKSELIKNLCLKVIKDDYEAKKLNDKWIKIFEQVPRDDVFIRESLRSRYFDYHIKGIKKPVTASIANLFKIIGTKINEADDKEQAVRDYIDELSDDVMFISQLDDINKWKDNNTRKDIIEFELLKAIHIRVPIITANRRWKGDENFAEFLRHIIRFHFRNRTVASMPPSELDKLMIEIAEKINKKNQIGYENTLKDVLDVLNDHDVDDETFEFNLRTGSFGTPSISRYILYQIEKILMGPQSYVELKENLTLEHILPVEHKEWKKQKDEFFEGYDKSNTRLKLKDFVHRIGNMVLLNVSDNSSIQNELFNEKRILYSSGIPLEQVKQTVLTLSKIAGDYNVTDVPEGDIMKWTALIIEKRSECLAKMISNDHMK